MTVSRAFKRGTRASMRPSSRNRRVEWNANLKDMTRESVEQPERKWTPIRPSSRSPVETVRPAAQYETETIQVRDVLGNIEFEAVTVNRAHTVVDGWFHFYPDFFERRHIRVIEHARDLWRDVSVHGMSLAYEGSFDTRGLEIRFDDEASARAVNLLRRARGLVARWKWEVFENVIRWNEPYGFPGSRLFGDKPAREEWAKLVVRDVAEKVARSLFL